MRSRPHSLAISPGSSVALLFGLVLSTWAATSAHATTFTERVCGAEEPSAVQAQVIQEDVVAHLASGSPPSTVGGDVQVAFHVIWNGVDGNVTDAQIQDQIAELNLDFSGADGGYDTGYRFVLTSVDRTLNPDWFDLVMGSTNEKRMKETLAVDPTHHVNVYTARISALGWSTFPWGVAESDVHQGIVVHYGSVPGGYIANFNLGRTVTHEMGHYFGLLHTFFTGCLEPNDYVEDTPAEAQQTTGCPPDGTDTCSLPGVDPIHNYLDYSYDACYAEFTRGQDARMDSLITTYKPHFLVAPLAVHELAAGRIATLRPVVPNPSSRRARIVFGLRRKELVTLRVHDLAGRVVANLVDGVLPAGEYARMFEPAPGRSGVYFADLVVGDERVSERLVLTR